MVIYDLVVEEPSHAKAVSTGPPFNLIYLSTAKDLQLISIVVWRRNQNLNQHIASHRRRNRALDQCPIQRNVPREAGGGMLALFLPVEGDGQLTAIPHG